jgi:hypothetical protein
MQYQRGVVWFISHFADSLEVDRLFFPAIASLVTCLDRWTSKFKVVHLGREYFVSMGAVAQEADIVLHGDTVGGLVEAMCEQSKCRVFCLERIAKMTLASASPAEAAWFLELLRQEKSSEIAFKGGCLDIDRKNMERLVRILVTSPLYAKSPAAFWTNLGNVIQISI